MTSGLLVAVFVMSMAEYALGVVVGWWLRGVLRSSPRAPEHEERERGRGA